VPWNLRHLVPYKKIVYSVVLLSCRFGVLYVTL
jgi:hypothetical protein